VLERGETFSARQDEPAYRVAAMLAYGLTQQRHRIRRDLDLPHDEYDDLADRLRDALDGVPLDGYDGDDGDDGDLAVLFWPRAEFARLVVRWPVLTHAYGSSWDEHRDTVERGLQVASRSGLSGLAVLAGRIDDLAWRATPIRSAGMPPTRTRVKATRNACRIHRGRPGATKRVGAAPVRSTRSVAWSDRVPDRWRRAGHPPRQLPGRVTRAGRRGVLTCVPRSPTSLGVDQINLGGTGDCR
jgi:hypothetical protein